MDAVSQPVFLAYKPDSKPKLIEPYENEALIYFLTYSKHLSGRSSKQIREVEYLNEFYTIETKMEFSFNYKVN